MADGPSSPRDRLLEAILAHVAEHGTHELTLRGLAADVGTSHRMLSYHFGSRDGVLVAITRAVEARQREHLAHLVTASGGDLVDVMREMHRQLTDPSLWPQERLFFGLYARALQGHPDAAPLLDGVVDGWLAPLSALFERAGFSPDEALAEGRLALAVARGLLLDLLATGDREGIDRAMERFVARYADTGPPAAGDPGRRRDAER